MYFRFRGEFIAGYALDENIRLYATNRFGSQPGFSFYFRILAAGLLPWTGMVLGRLVDDLRTVVRRAPTDAHPARDSVEILLWAWVIAVVGFFSLSRFKLDHYVFPAAPAICLLLARAWADLRAAPMAPEHRWTRLGQQLVGPLLVVMGAAGAFVLVARLELAAGAILVPVVIAACGVFVTIGARQPGRRLPRVPWLAASALTVAFVGVLVFVMPALEQQKVVPDVARWVASHAEPGRRVASYQLNRWNTAFRFYVDRHTTLLESPEEAGAFLRSQEPFYCVMVERAYEDLVARGLPLTKVYERDGMWATAGRALWRSRLPPTRFVVVTRALLPG
jgi:4-amino-4-deoxy-L-arabinose transferase-like glycosyltransferase